MDVGAIARYLLHSGIHKSTQPLLVLISGWEVRYSAARGAVFLKCSRCNRNCSRLPALIQKTGLARVTQFPCGTLFCMKQRGSTKKTPGLLRNQWADHRGFHLSGRTHAGL